ncbi:PASTA domain-containing protein [Streptomyces sp. NPDC017673]|uniref:PASTA domain-containing protein n=1 Tax=unclassified Streptomyces TaxID=2593676 RepID=UPI0037B556C2
MANWKLIGGIAGGVIVIGAIGNAVNGDNGGKDNASAAPAPSSVASSAAATPTPADADSKAGSKADAVSQEDEKKAVPDFVGMGLQSAQDHAQETGFYSLTSHDSSGRARMQILDRDWKVCSQNIKAGTTTATTTKLDFGAVKLSETCPAEDQDEPSAAGGTMPDFHGKSVKAARQALDSGTSLTVNDVSGEDRFVLLESNWRVCGQKPAAGAKLNGQPVTLNAVKYGENCP